ncbi:hypothetical protein IQ07DRAFT_194633 [Pyrenochaeta sp. DS3sAY3a]|nr:hypothetical protein IQ07DRAFT_194633 [Pyrenochaeta sp. DS3sAY3a]
MEPSDTIITLEVVDPDGNTKALNVHRGVLCKSSEFFQKALQPEWIKKRERPDVIDLREDPVRVVSDYIRWLYSGNVPIQFCKPNEGASKARIAEEAESVFVLTAESYVFGEKILDATYKNAMMRTVLAAKEAYFWNLGPRSVDIIYRGTPSTSLFRRLIADMVAHCAFDDSISGFGWMEFFGGYPKEALVDAMKATVRVRPMVTHSMPLASAYFEEEK